MEQTRPHWVNTLILAGGELALALVALPFYVFLVLPKYPQGALPGFVPVMSPDANPVLAVLATIAVVAVCIGIVAGMSKAFGADKFQIDELDILLRENSTLDLVIIYIAAGFAEEFLFRVTLMDLCGIVLSTILFTAMHAAYWRKPLMLVYVFLVGLVMGLLYLYTGSLLLCAIAHAVYNLLVSLMMKAGILPLGK